MSAGLHLTIVTDSKDIKSALDLISEELYVTGYPVLPTYDESKVSDCLISLINSVWTLIKDRKKYICEKRENDHSKMLIEQRIKLLEKRISDLEDSKKSLQTIIKKKSNELEVLKMSNERVLNELCDSKKAYQKLEKVLFNKNEHFCGRIRQKECEIIELQKMLSQKVNKKTCFRNSSNNSDLISLHSDNDRQINDRGNDEFKEIEKLHVLRMCKLENTIQTLVQENINLRNSMELFFRNLNKLYKDISNILSVSNLPEDSNNFHKHELLENEGDSDNNMRHLFNIHGDSIIYHVEEYSSNIMHKISELIKTFKSPPSE